MNWQQRLYRNAVNKMIFSCPGSVHVRKVILVNTKHGSVICTDQMSRTVLTDGCVLYVHIVKNS